MNYTKNILLMAAITSLLIMGTTITPMLSYASEHKKTSDFKSSIKASTEVGKKSSSQEMDQDNFCYRGDDCQQANEGQQIVGKDNEAKGFNDQSANIQQAPTSATTPPPNQNTTPPPTPTSKTCLECFTSYLTPSQITVLETILPNLTLSDITTIQQFCDLYSTAIAPFPETHFKAILAFIGVDQTAANALVECLKSAGVRFTP